jgi:hypothetical protein
MICPHCLEESLTPYMGGQFGTYFCKSCEYIGAVYFEKDE